jgi:hypothetical protein
MTNRREVLRTAAALPLGLLALPRRHGTRLWRRWGEQRIAGPLTLANGSVQRATGA